MWHVAYGVILWRPSIHLEGMRKTTTVLSQDTRSTSPDFNSGRLPIDMEQVSLRYNTSLLVYRVPQVQRGEPFQMKAIRMPQLRSYWSLAINHGLATVACCIQYMARCNRDLSYSVGWGNLNSAWNIDRSCFNHSQHMDTGDHISGLFVCLFVCLETPINVQAVYGWKAIYIQAVMIRIKLA